MLFECPAMKLHRESCSIGPFIAVYRKIIPQISSLKLFALFLKDFRSTHLKDRILSLYHMKLNWHKLMDIPL